MLIRGNGCCLNALAVWSLLSILLPGAAFCYWIWQLAFDVYITWGKGGWGVFEIRLATIEFLGMVLAWLGSIVKQIRDRILILFDKGEDGKQIYKEVIQLLIFMNAFLVITAFTAWAWKGFYPTISFGLSQRFWDELIYMILTFAALRASVLLLEIPIPTKQWRKR